MNQIVSTVLTQAEPPLAVTDRKAPLNFIRRQDTKPVFHSAALASGQTKFFFDPEAHTVPISDMREIAETLSVDREGFELLRHQGHRVWRARGEHRAQGLRAERNRRGDLLRGPLPARLRNRLSYLGGAGVRSRTCFDLRT